MAKRLKWGTIENLKELVNQYFAETATPNPAGLCIKLGIHRDTWHYYTSNKWRTNRLKEEELEEKLKAQEDECAEGILEDDVDISPNYYLLEEFSQENRQENEHIKKQVSDILKIASLRMEDFNNGQIYTSKNPGPIFMAKAVFGYRETAPEQDNAPQKVAPIIINILPPPDKPREIEAIEVTPLKIESK